MNKIDKNFIHDFGNWYQHNYKGSLNRHLAIEKTLIRFQKIYKFIGDAFPIYDLIYSPMHLFFGLNCNFPLRDIALYIIWDLKMWYRIEIKKMYRAKDYRRY